MYSSDLSNQIVNQTFNISRIIESVELFASLVPVNNQTDNSMASVRNFTRDNFAIYIRIADVFQGPPLQVLSDQDINDLNFTQVSFNSITDNTGDVLASVLLTSELFELFQENSPPNERFPRLLVVVYDVNSSLFQDRNPGGNFTGNATGGVVLSVRQSQPNLMQLQNSPAPSNLNEAVMFQFQTTEVNILLASCLFLRGSPYFYESGPSLLSCNLIVI